MRFHMTPYLNTKDAGATIWETMIRIGGDIPGSITGDISW